MAFVMIATGATSRAPVRSVPLHALVLGATAVALALLASGAALGYWFAAAPTAGPSTELAVVAPASRVVPAALPYTLEQLGALSGRLFRLESEAAQLARRLGVAKKDAPASKYTAGKDAPALKEIATKDAPPSKEMVTPSDVPAGASGGPLLAPHPLPADPLADVGALDAQLGRIERQIAVVAEAAALRTLEFMRLPTRSPIAGAALSSTFGNRVDPFARTHAFHAGLDFAAGLGTPIRSAAGGVVVFAGMRTDYGRVVEIDHGNGLKTRYAHASKLLVETGALVAPGDPIALVGSTGRSTGPHLHFEVLRGGTAVDPKRYLAGL